MCVCVVCVWVGEWVGVGVYNNCAEICIYHC